MEQSKKKARICLFFVVAAAIVIGMIYYVTSENHDISKDNGVLVRIVKPEEGKRNVFESDFIYQRG